LKAFLDPATDYDFSGDALKKHWSRLHRGDCEPYPAASALKNFIEACPGLQPSMLVDQAAEALQFAWRSFHRGEFREAERLGLSVGLLGFNVANKAANIRATYMETAKKKKMATFLEVAHRAEDLQRVAPPTPNAWYLHAQALGRHAQGVSVIDALAQGVASKVKEGLEKTLKLEPHHADAHVAFGTYHAELIDKVGSLVGGLTYGASANTAIKHFEKALKLNPDSAVARIEYANALPMMFGDTKKARVRRLYEEASKCIPADAMERLDVELARAQLNRGSW
jgi:tetratricopeptide (TPR) repeat protein